VNGLDAKEGRRTVSASAGALFGRSQAMAEEVHQAMTARGWNGDARALGTPRVGRRDVGFLFGCIALGGCLLAIDRALV
jgi:cobalt/nickel transport system permease protein